MNHADYYVEYMGRMFEKGEAAHIIQPYPEVNKKRGLAWEVSRLVSAASAGDKFYSIMKVGSKNVDLKDRILGSTGGGVIGRAYRIKPSDVTLNNPVKWFNYRTGVDSNLIQPETKVYVESDITFNVDVTLLAVEANKIHADIFAITNTQNQGKGIPFLPFGGNHIYEPFDLILLELESYDSLQDITAKLEIYEGWLDFSPEV